MICNFKNCLVAEFFYEKTLRGESQPRLLFLLFNLSRPSHVNVLEYSNTEEETTGLHISARADVKNTFSVLLLV